jgi:hypothetical protein
MGKGMNSREGEKGRRGDGSTETKSAQSTRGRRLERTLRGVGVAHRSRKGRRKRGGVRLAGRAIGKMLLRRRGPVAHCATRNFSRKKERCTKTKGSF